VILLPLVAWLAWVAALQRTRYGVLESGCAALIVLGVVVSIGTELQSAAGLLNATGSATLWIIASGAAWIVARRARGVDTHATIDRSALLALWPVALLLALTLVVALCSAPNSYDGLTYHLVRVERWIQQGSLRPFATFNTRQLFMPSWAEYGVLQFELLSGGDRFASMVQWIGFAGACGGAALLARVLGGSTRAAVLAAIVVATLPMAVAQSSGTQTDLTAACWCAVACGFGYRFLGSRRRLDAAFAALAFGLATATKQTGLLFAGAALLPLIVLVARRSWRSAAAFCAGLCVAIALIAGPQMARNAAVFGDPAGDATWRNDAAMQTHAPAQVFVNVLRNLSLHLGTPWSGVNSAVTDGVSGLSRTLGVNPDDQRTTWNPKFIPTPWNTHEESAPNPLHLLLIAGCIVALFRSPPRRTSAWIVMALAGAFVIFCAELKWQSYNSRLQTPLFVLAAAIAAGELDRLAKVPRQMIIGILLIGALPVALLGYTRPLLSIPGNTIAPRPSVLTTPRSLTYFMYEPALARPYLDIVDRIAASGCGDVGTHTWPDAWEYPVMALTRSLQPTTVFRPIAVPNISARYADQPGKVPCLLLQIWPNAGKPPSWAADWQLVVHWDMGPNRVGVALFAPPASSGH
jgi:hypothetical protein